MKTFFGEPFACSRWTLHEFARSLPEFVRKKVGELLGLGLGLSLGLCLMVRVFLFHYRAKPERAEGEWGLSTGELGCRRRRQTSSPSELRYIIIIPEWLVVRIGVGVRVRVSVSVCQLFSSWTPANVRDTGLFSNLMICPQLKFSTFKI